MFKLPELPYDISALEPYISAQTLNYHYHKHHQAYLDNLNNLTKSTSLQNMPLKDLIIKSAYDNGLTMVFNNAAQVFNHSFFWNSMKKNGGGNIPLNLKTEIEKNFKSISEFIDIFKSIAMAQFGSGWVWIVKSSEGVQIIKTSNADTPIAHGMKPLLTLDLWEHSYYLDYQNRRADYVQAFLDNLVNWEFADKNLQQAAE